MSQDIFYQVLLFRDKKSSLELGPALWAALAEVAALYNFDEKRANFRRYYLAHDTPESISHYSDFDAEKARAALGAKEWWEPMGGWSSTIPPLDTQILLKQVRKLLGDQSSKTPMVVVTDLEIEPPDGWRYIIWEKGAENESAVSLQPTDPIFWGLKDVYRVSNIKHRVRTACCSSIGQHLGFKRCDNPQCFLYGAVQSVEQLDSMILLGEEHEKPQLAGRGFTSTPEDPARVEQIQDLSSVDTTSDAAIGVYQP